MNVSVKNEWSLQSQNLEDDWKGKVEQKCTWPQQSEEANASQR